MGCACLLGTSVHGFSFAILTPSLARAYEASDDRRSIHRLPRLTTCAQWPRVAPSVLLSKLFNARDTLAQRRRPLMGQSLKRVLAERLSKCDVAAGNTRRNKIYHSRNLEMSAAVVTRVWLTVYDKTREGIQTLHVATIRHRL